MIRHRILVVDDDPELRLVTSELLELDGHEVRTLDGPFGTTSAIIDFDPHLVLLDVNMPGLSGDRLATLIAQGRAGGHTRVVLYSSNDEDALRAAVGRSGAAGYICKGDGRRLRNEVRSLLGAP